MTPTFEGSFGTTGCHDTNLLHPTKCRIGMQDRLCFVQPGSQSQRIVLTTPPVRVQRGGRIVVRWEPMPPLKYEEGLPFDAELARCFNPLVESNVASIGSRLRSWSHPAINPEQVLVNYDEWLTERAGRPRAFATRDRDTIDPLDHRHMPPEK